MNINRFNYEEYFLLYVDNELSAVERKAVEAFVKENADLEEELTMLKQSQLKPDASVVMEDKSVLFKRVGQPLIDLRNYETFFLLYVDEELSVEERREVEVFASKHPSLQQELQILIQTKLEADNKIVFPDKNLLYKVAANERVISIKVWRAVAIAAMLLIAVGILWVNSGSDRTTGDPGKYARINEAKPENKQQPAQNSKSVANEKSNPGLPVKSDTQSQIAEQTNHLNRENKEPKKPSNPGEQSREIATAVESTSTEFQEIRPRLIASVNVLDLDVSGTSNVSNKVLKVEEPVAQANSKNVLTGIEPELDGDGEIAIGPVQTKNKLRGFFRQVTRVVEKTTHLPAGQNKKLLIGNIEIALK